MIHPHHLLQYLPPDLMERIEAGKIKSDIEMVVEFHTLPCPMPFRYALQALSGDIHSTYRYGWQEHSRWLALFNDTLDWTMGGR